MDTDYIKREIRTLEDKRCQAMIAKDTAVLGAMLAESLIYTHSSAQTDTKAQYIEAVRTGVFDYKKIERFDEVTQVYGDHTTVNSGRAEIDVIARGTPKKLNIRFVNVWVNMPQGWQFVAWQSTPIPA
ncbi:MAG: nuclear transport factor 2 family protein [Burkholderiales bacterium]